jgi:hypothetical protein
MRDQPQRCGVGAARTDAPRLTLLLQQGSGYR